MGDRTMTVRSFYGVVAEEAYDGDTIRIDLDLGMDIWVRRYSIRLYGINAPELREPEGPASRDALRSRLPIGTRVFLTSYGYDKYGGRIDCVIFVISAEGSYQSINQWMIDERHAVVYRG